MPLPPYETRETGPQEGGDVARLGGRWRCRGDRRIRRIAMSTTRKIAAGAVIGVLTILAGTAFALSNISLTLGSLPGSYDFGTVNLTTGGIDPVGTKPA